MKIKLAIIASHALSLTVIIILIFFCIEPEGNSIKIEQIRELQKKIQEKPIISEKKVYIIDQADLMTKEAQNCLLKTLEEPPEFVTIILVGTNENAFFNYNKIKVHDFTF